MPVIWCKVWRDLTLEGNRARTVLVVLSTAVGVFALGVVFGLSGVIRARLTEVHQASVPAHITFWGGPFSRDVVNAIRHDRGVLDAEGGSVAPFRWKFEGEEKWRKANVIALDDYEAQRMNLIRRQDGRWPGKRALCVERLSSNQLDIPTGTTILVESGGRERRVPVEGVVHAHAILAPEWGGEVTFFATQETAAWLTEAESGEVFTQLHVRLESYSEQTAKEIAERIKDRLARVGLTVGGYEITDPDAHWMQDMVDAVLIVLAVMGVLLLALSAFLIISTVNGIIAGQVWQIGVMKAIGATAGRVTRVYLASALVYGGLALLLAVPSGVLAAHLVAAWLLGMFNVEAGAFQIEPAAIGIQVAVGLAVPVLAALGPVLGGARVTVRQAISTHGVGRGFGRGWLDGLIGRIRGLPSLLALSLRNTFRRKARLVLTLVTLTLSGAVFIIVMSAGDSFSNTMRIMFEIGGDVSITMERPHRVSRLRDIAGSVPGVTRAEVWSGQPATLSQGAGPQREADGEEHPVHLVGVPAGSTMFSPRITGGRSLLDGDGRAALVNHRLAEEQGIRTGEEVTLTMGGKESTWMVVGSYLSVNTLADELFVPLDALSRETGTWGRGTTVVVRSAADGIGSEQRLIGGLTDAFAAHHIEVDDSWSASKQWEESQSAFGALIYLLLAMAVLTAAVGGIGLMSTTSINVVERTREIGVMRAIGATSLAIVGLFIAEGVQVGILSWLLAVPLSYPGARLLSGVIGETVLDLPLEFAYSVGGMALWLVIVVVLSALASLWPALRAAQVSVREALAYE